MVSRISGFLAIALLTVSMAGNVAFATDNSSEDSYQVSNCFPQVSSSVARLERKLDRMEEACNTYEPGGELQKVVHHASKTAETYFWQLNSICDKDSVRQGYELLRGKLHSVDHVFNNSALKGNSDVRDRMDRLAEASRELGDIIRAL